MLTTIDRQEGHGCYFYVIGYRDVDKALSFVVFSYIEDANDFKRKVIANGRKVEFGPSLASDFCRHVAEIN